MTNDKIKDMFKEALDLFLDSIIDIIQEMIQDIICENDPDLNQLNDEDEDRDTSQDIIMCYEHGVPIIGEIEEVKDALPEELEGCFSFEDGVIYFGKKTTFNTMASLMQSVNMLAKRIRPSRGNLTAPEFRELMEEWRTNMINDARQKNDIDLDI